ncbi:MAG: mannosyl-3-phosphoglycerate phosphatase [Desulfuromonas sp.]|nr:MAG: mannosyl-3-phosphoglycerate phosphatase [Desulfuromonas sp.]
MDMKRLIIFTDLDGTLLDHDTYSWQPAADALEKIRLQQIPLIINSSKTKAEIEQLRMELDNHAPFIVENGGAVYLLDSGATPVPHRFGKPYGEIVSILDQLRQKMDFRFRGFSDLTDDELSDLTGLTRTEVVPAKKRSCSEPLLWDDSESNFELFSGILSEQGLQTVKGGRFIHIMGQTDKGRAMIWLLEHFKRQDPATDWTVIALGDSANDKPMLELADYAVVIRPATGEPLKLDKTENIILTDKKGPAGWQEAMNQLLDQTGA